MDTDMIDYAILTCLKTADRPLWKKALHQRLDHQAHRFPRDTTPSMQTVIRRIDRLHEHGHVSSTIVDPAEISRELIIAYEITDAGQSAVQETQEDLIAQYSTALLAGEPVDAPKPVLLALLKDRFQCGEDTLADLKEHCSSREILLLLTLQQLQTVIADRVQADTLQQLQELIGDEISHRLLHHLS